MSHASARLFVVALGAAAALVAAPARAHEPLWGETPTVFGFGVLHAQLRYGFKDAGSRSGGGVRARSFDQEYMVEYAPSTAINLMLEIPWVQQTRRQRIGGRKREVTLSGLGDIHLMAKRRFSAHRGDELLVQHSLLYGLKLPTGENKHRDPNGRRAAPYDQPGTGKPGLMLGYAWDRETLEDTVWASGFYTRELGGGFRMGDVWEADAAYGRWLIRPNEAQELGLNLAFGVHGEYKSADRLAAGRNARNAYGSAGFQLTPILTKGVNQLRIGVFVPVLRHGPGDYADFPYEVRFAFETFF